MPVDAVRLIRKMRGGAQAHLLEASDGRFYVVKFLNNPQHRRILVNEWIASEFLGYLGIAVPRAAIVRVTESFLEKNPDCYLQLGSRRLAVTPGWHFGSAFPGNPARQIVYDFLPDAILPKVENLTDFLGALVFDKWTGNADSRQSIFFRARLKEHLPGSTSNPARLGLVAQMVDHGYIFEGPHWNLPEGALQGLYFRPTVYSGVRGFDDFQPWLDRIIHFPEEVVDRAISQIPPAWLAGDEAEFSSLLVRLMARRHRVPALLEESKAARTNPFPNWQS
jgi:hypothetical protein